MHSSYLLLIGFDIAICNLRGDAVKVLVFHKYLLIFYWEYMVLEHFYMNETKIYVLFLKYMSMFSYYLKFVPKIYILS